MQSRVVEVRKIAGPAAVLAAILATQGVVLAETREVRRITQTEATSDCIGEPKTPLCAAETFLACTTRRKLELCHAVGVSLLSFDEDTDGIEYAEYVVLSQKVLRPENIAEDLKDSDWYRPGHVDIDLDKREYQADGTVWPRTGWGLYGIVVKPVGDKWHVASWALAGEEDFPE